MDRAYPRLLLGCGNFGGIGSAPAFFGRGETLEQAIDLMDAAWEAGIRWFDTADAYGGGRSESYVGEWIRTRKPDGLRITTKTFNPMAEGEDHGLAPARVRRQIDSSLRRLGVERVDLYLAHAPDPDVPAAELAGVFEELVAAGKIGAYGLSNVDGAQLREALAAGNFSAVQNSYSLLDREAEQEVLPLCAEHGLWFQIHSPLMGGWLTGKYRRDAPAPEGSRMTLRSGPYEHLRDDRVYDALEELERRGDPTTLALAWLLADDRVSVVLGPRRPEHLQPGLDALANPLTQDERDALSDEFRRRPPVLTATRREEPEVDEMLTAYAAAVRAKDVDAFVGLYADDVRTFDLWQEWTYDGKDALRGMVAEWFGSLADDEEVAVRFDDVRTQAGPDVAAVSAFTTFAAVSPDGTESKSMNNRLTWVLRKEADGSWKIAHEHTSAPAGDEGKVQLRR